MKSRVEYLGLSGKKLIFNDFINFWSEVKKDGSVVNAVKAGEQHFDFRHLQQDYLTHLYIELDSKKKIEVIVYGRGEPLLLISGIGVTAPIWFNQIEQLSSEHTVIIVHAPGHGLSEVTKDLSYSGVSSTICKVLDIIGINKSIHIVGTCLGGNIAIAFAAMFPDYVSTLTLVNTVYDYDTDAFDNGPLNRQKVGAIMSFLKSFDNSLNRDFEWIINEKAKQGSTLNNYERERMMYVKSKNIDPYAYIQYVFDISKNKRIDDIAASITSPTLLVTGSRDMAVDVKNSQILRSFIKDSEYIEMCDAGHYPYISHPGDFNDIVRNFIRKNS